MLNRVELIGNVGGEVTANEVGDGHKAAKLSLATHRRWGGKDGTRQEETQWHPVVFWRKQAELADGYSRKGSSCTWRGD